VSKSVGARGDFEHFLSLEQRTDCSSRLTRSDFLLVFASGLDGSIVETSSVKSEVQKE